MKEILKKNKLLLLNCPHYLRGTLVVNETKNSDFA